VAHNPTAEQPVANQALGDQSTADKPTAEGAGKERKTKKPWELNAEGKLSAIDAAAKVLTEADKPMTTKEMIAAIAEKEPRRQTPAATLYSTILREITVKGAEAQFQKTERGKFAVRVVALFASESQQPV
jgi:hypothetical protein